MAAIVGDNSIYCLIRFRKLGILFIGILFNNFMDKWEGKVSEVSASLVPTLMHLLFNTISKYSFIRPII